MAKTLVEDGYKLTIYFLKKYLRVGYYGSVHWSRGDREIGYINYHVLGDDEPSAIRLMYKTTPWGEQAIDLDYIVELTTTALAWGKKRYWFLCPLPRCGRRVGCLYLPPGGKYFGCRHCYNLAYQSNQESSFSRAMDKFFYLMMKKDLPGLTRRDFRAAWADKTTPHLRKLEKERYLDWLQSYDPHQDYLSAQELCRKCKLDPGALINLEAVRLLVPDTKDGRYRPKLVGWGRKLVYLLRRGWSVQEIQAWSKVRWKKKNPRQWPPAKPIDNK